MIKRDWHDAWWRLVSQPHPRSWKQAAALKLFDALSALFLFVVALRNACYKRRLLRAIRLPAVVVSVGNLSVGGTGKTSCVELLAGKLQCHGRRVAILSRGYGSKTKNYRLTFERGELLADGKPINEAQGIADEPQLLARALPEAAVFVGPKRVITGQNACSEWKADLLLLDDGFQHRQVHRDCDIVLVSAKTPFGGWPLLPRGPMREPLSSINRADVVIITKADEAFEKLSAFKERLAMINREAIVVTAVHEPVSVQNPITRNEEPAKLLEGKRAALVSSIGDPEGFEAIVRRLHASVMWHQAFPDHHCYTREDLAVIAERARQTKPDLILTTAKDWMRLQGFAADISQWLVPVRVLAIKMKIVDGESKLDARLAGLFAR